MRYLYTAIFSPIENGKGYEARIPDIPHCVTSGRDIPDAMNMIADAASLMLWTMEDDRQQIPEATPPQLVQVPKGCVSSLVSVDTEQYRLMNDTKPVRKTVSIPAWMARRADQAGISLSKVLQDTLRNRLNP